MEPNFPSDFPMDAARQVVKFISRKDSDLSRAALAAWRVLGYAGHLAFGDVKFLTDAHLFSNDWPTIIADAQSNNIIPPELIDLALSILGRWLKQRFASTI